MSSSWDIVGGNPAPGDPGWIAQQASLLSEIGTDADGVQEQLSAIKSRWSNSDWSGDAAERFQATLGTALLPDLVKLTNSYGQAGTALQRFASALSTLQDDAYAALGSAQGAQSAIQSANQREAGGQGQVADGEVAYGEAEARIAACRAAIAARSLVPGLSVPDAVTNTLEAELSQALADRSTASAQIQAGHSTVRAAQADATEAQAQLNSARSTIQDVAVQFRRVASTASADIEGAAQSGMHNTSFLGRAEKGLLDGVRDVGRFELETALNIDEAAQGNFSGLEHELKEASLVGLEAVHDAAATVHDVASGVARIAGDASDVYMVLALVCAVAAIFAGPEMLVPALSLAEAATDAATAASLVQLGASGVEDAADSIEVDSDSGQLALGGGSLEQLDTDTQQLVTDSIGTVEDGIGVAVGKVLPDPDAAINDAINGITEPLTAALTVETDDMVGADLSLLETMVPTVTVPSPVQGQ